MRKKRNPVSIAPRRQAAKISWLRRRQELRKKHRVEQKGQMEPLSEALKQATRTARNGWLFLLTLSVITIVTIASVSHTDLLLNASVKLPVVQIGVPVATFFVFAPFFLLAIHAEVLIRHANLAHRVRHIKDIFPEYQAEVFPSYHLVQIINGTGGFWRRQIYFLPHGVTLLVLPLFVLLYTQSSYLPLHDLQITWLHRALVGLDTVFLWLYVRSVWGGGKWQVLRSGLGLSLPVFFTLAVATIPGERIEKIICKGPLQSVCVPVPYGSLDLPGRNRKAFWPTAWLFEGDINIATGRLNSLLARNLVIMNGNLAGDGKDKPRLNLRSRDLRYAILDGSNLAGVDFTSSNMVGTRLASANLKGAVFGCANPGRAVLGLKPTPPKQSDREKQICQNWQSTHRYQKCVNLSEADLSKANLTSALIGDAMLSGANLSGAQMPKAVFSNGCLFTANMSGADLTGAEFSYTDMVGAAMRKTKLTGAVFADSDLSLANLTGADLRQVKFSNTFFAPYDTFLKFDDNETAVFSATLFAAILVKADLRCANFSEVAFLATDLSRAKIWRTVPPKNKTDFSFSALDKITVDKGKNPCANGDDATGKTELETWWEKAALQIHGIGTGWQDYVADALCHNIEYLRASPSRMYLYEDLWGYDFVYNTYEDPDVLPIDKRLSKLPEPPKSLPKQTIKFTKDSWTEESGTLPYIDPEVLWKRVKDGKCPAAKSFTDSQLQKLKQYAVWHKEKREKKKTSTTK